jgi:orotate phosphoribosyltransferase
VSLQPDGQPGRVLGLFEQTGAYLTGHFRLTSGLHSPNYLQSAIVLQHPEHATALGKEMAARILPLCGSYRPNVVVSPALGGMVIGHETARALDVRFIFTERDAERRMALRRGFTLGPGDVAVIVEDVITTGGSTREVIEIVQEAGALAVAAGSIIDRSGGAVDLGIPRAALETLHVMAYEPSVCPMCAAGQPVIKPGSRPV